MRNVIIYRNAEIALIAISILLMFTTSTGSFWKGVGMGLLTQATLVLFLDYFAEDVDISIWTIYKMLLKKYEAYIALT